MDNKAKLFSTLMLACSINTSSLPVEVITCIPTNCDVNVLVKGTVQLNPTAQRQQKEQQQKQRQRSSAGSNDSRVSATTSRHHSSPDGAPRWISGPSNSHQDFRYQHQQPATSRPNVMAPTPAITTANLCGGSLHRDASAPCWLLPESTADCFNLGSRHQDASAPCFPLSATAAACSSWAPWWCQGGVLMTMTPSTPILAATVLWGHEWSHMNGPTSPFSYTLTTS